MAETNNQEEKISKAPKEEEKKETFPKEEVKKGYNEKNPTQPQGAFKPDSAK